MSAEQVEVAAKDFANFSSSICLLAFKMGRWQVKSASLSWSYRLDLLIDKLRGIFFELPNFRGLERATYCFEDSAAQPGSKLPKSGSFVRAGAASSQGDGFLLILETRSPDRIGTPQKGTLYLAVRAVN